METSEPPGYDPERDPVLLAAWAHVEEHEANLWMRGETTGSAHDAALARAAREIHALLRSPEYEEILEEVTRFRRIPPLRRLQVSDEATRFDLRLQEAYRRGVG